MSKQLITGQTFLSFRYKKVSAAESGVWQAGLHFHYIDGRKYF